MESETVERASLQVGGISTVVETAPAHNPAPRIDLVSLPSGAGAVALVKVGEAKWQVERFDGPSEGVVRHTFRSIESLVAWLKANANDPARVQVFADLRGPIGASLNGKPTIAARLDPGDPNGDRVVGEVAYSAAVRAWVIETAGKRLDQRGLFALVRGYGKVLYGAHTADGLLGSLAALRVIGTQTLECELAANGRTLISGAKGELRVTQELPGVIELDLPIYQGVQSIAGVEAHYRLECLLDVETTPAGLSVGLTFPSLAETIALADRDLVEHVQRALGEPWLVCLGTETAAEVPKRDGVDRIGQA